MWREVSFHTLQATSHSEGYYNSGCRVRIINFHYMMFSTSVGACRVSESCEDYIVARWNVSGLYFFQYSKFIWQSSCLTNVLYLLWGQPEVFRF